MALTRRRETIHALYFRILATNSRFALPELSAPTIVSNGDRAEPRRKPRLNKAIALGTRMMSTACSDKMWFRGTDYSGHGCREKT